MEIEYRKALPDDIGEMIGLILKEGRNPYNYIPEEGVKNLLHGIETGESEAVLSVSEGKIIGFVCFVWGRIYPQYEPRDKMGKEHGYIAEVVVAESFRGKGIGTWLIELAKRRLLEKGFSTIYIKRHAENAASAMMMEKAGFREVDTFYDPEIRTYGNRKTTVCRFTKD